MVWRSRARRTFLRMRTNASVARHAQRWRGRAAAAAGTHLLTSLALPGDGGQVGLSYDMMFKHGKGMAGHDEAGYTPPHAAIGPVPLKVRPSHVLDWSLEGTGALDTPGFHSLARGSPAVSMSRTTCNCHGRERDDTAHAAARRDE